MLARILNLAPARLSQTPENPVDALIEYFLWLDEAHDANFYGEMARLSDFLPQYWNKRSRLSTGEIPLDSFPGVQTRLLKISRFSEH